MVLLYNKIKLLKEDWRDYNKNEVKYLKLTYFCYETI